MVFLSICIHSGNLSCPSWCKYFSLSLCLFSTHHTLYTRSHNCIISSLSSQIQRVCTSLGILGEVCLGCWVPKPNYPKKYTLPMVFILFWFNIVIIGFDYSYWTATELHHTRFWVPYGDDGSQKLTKRSQKLTKVKPVPFFCDIYDRVMKSSCQRVLIFRLSFVLITEGLSEPFFFNCTRFSLRLEFEPPTSRLWAKDTTRPGESALFKLL